MIVIAKQALGFATNGGHLLHAGRNVLREPLDRREREFVDAMLSAGLVTIEAASPAEPPRSETKIGAAAKLDEESDGSDPLDAPAEAEAPAAAAPRRGPGRPPKAKKAAAV
jgi:hypothetical protein